MNIFIDRYGDTHIWVYFVFVILGITFAGTLLIAGVNQLQAKTCSEYAVNLEANHKYSIWHGCLLEKDGKWFPKDQYRKDF